MSAVEKPVSMGEALDDFTAEIIRLEALATAAAEAVTRLPCGADERERTTIGRVYALVRATSTEATLLLRRLAVHSR